MKILIFYTYNKSFLSRFFQELSEKLSDDGYDVINFYLKKKKENFVQNGVFVYGDKKGWIPYNYHQIFKIIRRTKPDIVISNFSYINPAILFGKLMGVSWNIAWFHSAYHHTKPSKFKVFNKSLYLKQADLVIANSKLLERELINIYGVSQKRTRCVPFWTNILDYESKIIDLGKSDDKTYFRIGCPGRLLEDKNQEIVIKTLRELKKDSKRNIQLFFAGNGINKSHLKYLVTQLELDDEVFFLGALSVEEMTGFYEQMDVLVFPSLNEAFGLVFIEAIAKGRPVIVSENFGALDFIDTSKFTTSEFTFNPKSVSDLRTKLISYLEGHAPSESYFKELYNQTFDKMAIYQHIKSILTYSK